MKPRKPQPVSSQKAPWGSKPKAPFARNHETPLPAQRRETRDSKPPVFSKSKGEAPKSSGTKNARPKPPALKQSKLRQSAPTKPAPASLGIGALIRGRAADRLRNGYLWVYASDIESVELPDPDNPPALLPVADSRGLLLGTALYSPASQIALRMVSREAIDEAAWLELLAERLRASIARRGPMLDSQTDSCRLCFSEADELPGLIVDKYGNLSILQLLTRGLLSAGVRETIVRVLREELAPATIVERPDPRMRELEGLDAPSSAPLFSLDPAQPAVSSQFRLNGLDFHFERQRSGNTFDAHRLLHLAAERGVQDAVKERFLRGYMTDGEAIGNPDALVRMAAEAGLPEEETRKVLATDAYAAEVREDEAQAQELGISGVPFFVIGGRYGLSGAQPAEVILEALNRAL